MLKWFAKWNREHPFDLVEAVAPFAIIGGGVAATAVLVAFGGGVFTTSIQTGPDGTGMQQIEFNHDIRAQVAANALPESEEPWIPADGDVLAADAYENVQVLGHLTEDNFNRVMAAITEWVSPEEGCAYCHGEDGDFASDAPYAKNVARKMIQMTWAINEGYGEHVQETGVTCYTCHRGANVPEYVWTDPTPVHEAVTGIAAFSNQASAATSYTSLPVNALQRYFNDYESAIVVSQSSREDNEGAASIQQTEYTYSVMHHFSDSLGVGCTYCHNSRAIADYDQSTPQRTLALMGVGMVRDINEEYVAPLADILPAHRLGPKGDAPKTACFTCHQGAAKPLLGQSMLANWPELASETPVYE